MWCTTRLYFGTIAVLVVLYINDLPECLKNTRPRLFADDTNLTASSHSIGDIEIAVNSDLENASNSQAIVRPYFDYCSEVWDVFGEIQSKRLQKLQNRAARTISNMSDDVDYSIALCALGWKPLDIMRKKAKATMMYKTLNGIGPESLTNLFTYKNEITNYRLRSISSGLCLPQPRTNSMKVVSCMMVLSYGTLFQNEIRESKSLSCFQKNIAAHIF